MLNGTLIGELHRFGERLDYLSSQLLVDVSKISLPFSPNYQTRHEGMGAFLHAVREVFGHDEVERAANLWITRF